MKINIPFSPPDITEEEINEVVDALKSGWITTGPKTKQLEKNLSEYIGTNRSATTNSATAAMEMTLRLLDIGPGDEVITSAYTYTASASVIHHVGAKIVLVDTDKDSFEMDYEQVSDVITSKTKAIIPVDIAGKMCNYDKLKEVLEIKKNKYEPKKNTLQEKFDRPVILADAAHSLGATYKGKNSGQVADFTCFSFHAVKNLTTAEGGAVTWLPIEGVSDEEIYKKYMLLILHGQSKDALSKSKLGAWEYDIVAPYYKANMTDIHAAIGLVQLKRYPELLKTRRNLIDKYEENLNDSGIDLLSHYSNDSSSSGHLLLTNLLNVNETDRNKFIEKLAERGIAANVHYKPLPLLTAYKKLGFDIKDFPNAFNKYKSEVSLPLHTLLTNMDVDYITSNAKDILKDLGV